jgi:hypothetical protein
MCTSLAFVRVFQILQVWDLTSYSVNLIGTNQEEKEREVENFFLELIPKIAAILYFKYQFLTLYILEYIESILLK